MLHNILKAHSLVAVSLLSYIYLLGGLIINFLQLLTFIFVKTLSTKWGRKINGYLQASLFSVFTFVVEWHCNCNIRFFCFPEDVKNINREHCLSICNHRGEVDWLLGYVVTERLDCLRGCKSLIKKEAKYLPVVGWKMWFSDYLFLSRNWAKDADTIRNTCQTWASYDPHINNNFYVLYAEGTRFTLAKHEASIKFCEERSIEPFRNVLYPRTKGAVEVISQLGDSLDCVYDVVFAFPGPEIPGTWSMLAGKSTNVDVYFRRIAAEDVPKDDKDALAEFVVQQFRNKDELLDYHKEHHRFPGNQVLLPRRYISLVMFYIFSFLTVTPGVLFLCYLITNQCYNMLLFIGFCCILGGVTSNRIMSVVNVKQGKQSLPSTGAEKLKGA